jgi:PAS domain S-box-containing protein
MVTVPVMLLALFVAALIAIVGLGGITVRYGRALRRASESLRERTRELNESQALARLGSWSLDLVGNQLTWSDEVFRIFEIDARRFDASYGAFLSLVHPEDRKAVNEAYTASVARRTAYDIAHRLLLPDGRLKWVRERGVTFYAERSGRPLRSIGTVQEAMASVELSAAVQPQRDFAQLVLDTAPAIVLVLDASGRIQHVNRFFEELTGLRLEEVRGTDWFSTAVPPEEAGRRREKFREELADSSTRGVVASIMKRDGSRTLIEWNERNLPNDDGSSAGWLCIGLDIAERLRLEQQTRESEARLRAVINGMPAGIAICGRDGRVIEVNADFNSGALAGFGLDADAARGRELWDLGWAAPDDALRATVKAVMSRCALGHAARLDLELPVAPGQRSIVDTSFSPIRGADGQVAFIVAFGIDVSARRQAEGAAAELNREVVRQLAMLKESEDRFIKAFRFNPIPMLIRSLDDDRILDANAAMATLAQRRLDEIVGHNVSDLNFYSVPQDRAAILDAFRRRAPLSNLEVEALTASGERRWVLMTVEYITVQGQDCALLSLVDLTYRVESERHRRALEAQLHESRRLEAIGSFASGIVHDFNNILAVISGNVAVIRQGLAGQSAAMGSLDLVDLASQRGIDLVKQVAAFARGQRLALSPHSVTAAVSEAARMARSTLPPSVVLDLRVAAGPLTVLSGPGQIQQVAFNLIKNAVQALEGYPGSIVVSVRRVDDSGAIGAVQAASTPASLIVLSVADTGRGMTDDIRTRIFEPFFTTRGPGMGTGLGLAVVDGIVRSLNGTIRVQTAVGRGTTFEIRLPLAEQRTAPDREPQCTGSALPLRVLYVDDDAAFGEVVARMLGDRGWTVSVAPSPVVALERLQADRTAVDFVVSDNRMPQMTGLELLLAIRSLDPMLPVAIVSGDVDDELRANAIASGAVAVIAKCTTADRFIDALANCLAEVRRIGSERAPR